MRICEFKGCRRPHEAKGYCRSHYMQLCRGAKLKPIRGMRSSGSTLIRDEQGCKHCPRCDRWLAESEFGKSSRWPDGLLYQCKLCQRAILIEQKYGVTPEMYQEIMERQGWLCPVCSNPFTQARRPAVDHDHSCCPGKRACGKCVRGLLCGTCNLGLGNFKDDIGRLQGAIDYLTKQKEVW